MIRTAVGVLTIFFVACGGDSPSKSYEEVRAAAAEGNWLRFSRYVDVDQVITSFLNDAVGHGFMAADGRAGEAFGALMGSQVVGGMQEVFRPVLRDTVRAMVESGRFDFGAFLARMEGANSLRLDRVGDAIVEADVAAIPLWLDGLSEDDGPSLLRVDLMAERRSATWVFTRLDRLGPLFSAIEARQARQAAEGVERILETIREERRRILRDARPEWFHYDEAANTVTLDLVAGDNIVNNYWNFNGSYNGDAEIVVPVGATVVINFTNSDPNNVVHSIGVAPWTSNPPALVAPDPVFDGAISTSAARATEATATGESETITFTPSRTGEYSLACFVPGHAVAGMWIRFTVSGEGEVGVVF